MGYPLLKKRLPLTVCARQRLKIAEKKNDFKLTRDASRNFFHPQAAGFRPRAARTAANGGWWPVGGAWLTCDVRRTALAQRSALARRLTRARRPSRSNPSTFTTKPPSRTASCTELSTLHAKARAAAGGGQGCRSPHPRHAPSRRYSIAADALTSLNIKLPANAPIPHGGDEFYTLLAINFAPSSRCVLHPARE